MLGRMPPTIDTPLAIALLVGVSLGIGLLVWIFLSNKAKAIENDLAAANERAQALQHQVHQAQHIVEELQARIGDEMIRRSAAEERANRVAPLESQLKEAVHAVDGLKSENSGQRAQLAQLETRLQEERKVSEEKLAMLNEAQVNLSETFKSLSADALRSNNQSFLELAKENLEKYMESAKGDVDSRRKAIEELIKPLKESLTNVNAKIGEVEKSRVEAYASLREQVKSLGQSQVQLQSETASLVKALRSPIARGRWGEVQLQRVVEMAGMVDHCDFLQQESVDTDDGRQRPDMIVKLPNERNIVVDAKVPLAAYIDAVQTADEEVRVKALERHARHVKDHVKALGGKAYWKQFDPSPEFVVLFLPGEPFFSAALEMAPELIDEATNHQVIIATPTTLIALLRSVAYGWRQEQLTQNAQEIRALGQELYERIATMTNHFDRMRKGLNMATSAYNSAASSIESRLLVTARKFKELGVPGGEEPELDRVDGSARAIQIEDMRDDEDDETESTTESEQ